MPNDKRMIPEPLMVEELDNTHLGKSVAVLGLPPAVLHLVDHTGHGYTTLKLGNNTITVNSYTPVTFTTEVTGQ